MDIWDDWRELPRPQIYPGGFPFVFMGLLFCCLCFCPYIERVNQK